MGILKVVVIGIVLVFLILILLTLVLVLFRLAMGGFEKARDKKQHRGAEPENVETPRPENKESDDKQGDPSVICAIISAIEAYRDSTGDTGGFRVVAFKKTGRRR